MRVCGWSPSWLRTPARRGSCSAAEAELAHERHLVEVDVVARDLAAIDGPHVRGRQLDPLAGRRYLPSGADERRGVPAGDLELEGDSPVAFDRVDHAVLDVRERLHERPHPG